MLSLTKHAFGNAVVGGIPILTGMPNGLPVVLFKGEKMEVKFINKDRGMANGMRDTSGVPLSKDEIEFVLAEIRRIEADESVFVFNDPHHAEKNLGTGYNSADDCVYVMRNVFPDTRFASAHPRDNMSVAAVIAHEYYGHRPHRSEYLEEAKSGCVITPEWEDECRASLEAAMKAPNLLRVERVSLINDAIVRADEYNQMIEMNDFMKEVLYGYGGDEKYITGKVYPIRYALKESLG